MSDNDYIKFGLFERTGLAIILITTVGLTFSILYMLTIEQGGGGAGFESSMNMLFNAFAAGIMILMFGRPLVVKIRERRPIRRLMVVAGRGE